MASAIFLKQLHLAPTNNHGWMVNINGIQTYLNIDE